SIATREETEAARKQPVFARVDDLPPLDDNAYFLHELVGLTVATEDGQSVGIVDDVLDLPAQAMLVIGREDGSTMLVPAIPEFVVDIDFDSDRIVIRPIEGLLE